MGVTVREQPLSTDAFHRAVHALAPKVAVFDCDGTLWSGDAGSTFMKWTIDTGLVSREKARWIDDRYEGYLRGDVDEERICGEMVAMYAGLSERSMREAARIFFAESVEPNIFPEMRELVAKLAEGGTEIWAVSSTNDWVIEEGVRRFGIAADHVLAARVEAVEGVVTSRVLEVPTDEGKVRALKGAGVRRPDAVFGNSVHDAAMLAIARVAFPVNPTLALVERSERESWAVYYPASVRPLAARD